MCFVREEENRHRRVELLQGRKRERRSELGRDPISNSAQSVEVRMGMGKREVAVVPLLPSPCLPSFSLSSTVRPVVANFKWNE